MGDPMSWLPLAAGSTSHNPVQRFASHRSPYFDGCEGLLGQEYVGNPDFPTVAGGRPAIRGSELEKVLRLNRDRARALDGYKMQEPKL